MQLVLFHNCRLYLYVMYVCLYVVYDAGPGPVGVCMKLGWWKVTAVLKVLIPGDR